MACLTEDEIVALLDGHATADEHARIVEHTEACEACRRWVAEVTRVEVEPAVDAAAEGDAIVVGTSIGPYEVVRFVGRGATATVYAARDPRLDREVAIKVLHPSEGSEDLVDAEGLALARLRHPNVLTVHEVGHWRGRPYLVTELVVGGSLEDWSREAPRPVADVVSRLVEAGRGIAAAHAAGVFHGDIKPDNLVLDGAGVTVVADFGFAVLRPRAHEDTLGERRVGGGTPAYAAPERMRGAAADERSDQYAFGRTAQRVLAQATGRPPRAIVRALERAVDPEPAARHPDMASLVAVLERSRSRRPLRWGIGLALVVVAIGIASVVREDDARGLAEELAAAQQQWNDARDPSAEATLRRVVAQAEEAGARDVTARGRLALATLELERGAHDEALRQADQVDVNALTYADRGALHLLVAAVAYQRGELTSAARSCRASIEAFAAAEDPRIARARFNLGSILQDLGDLDAAARLFEEARDAFAENDSQSPDVGRAWHSLGAVANARGDAASAIVAFDEAETILSARLGAEHVDTLKATFGHGNALLRQGRHDDALVRFDGCANALASTEPVPALRIYCLDSKAKALMELQQPELARTCLEEAYALVVQADLGPRPIRATLPYDLARLELERDRLRTIELLLDAREVCARADWDCSELMGSINDALGALTSEPSDAP